MKILAYVHGYFPNHNAGAEAMLHQILFDLKARGHEVAVITKNPGAEEYEDIPIYNATGGTSAKEVELIRWCDIIFTHLDFTRIAVSLAKRYKKYVAHLVHNDKQLAYNRIFDTGSASLAIANSEWIKKTVKRGIPSTVVNPPTKPERYSVKTTKEYITLINMNEAKGGKLFWELARIMPDRQFLGVKGAYGEQIEFDRKLDNVTILDNTPEIQDIYAKTNILLVPSHYESWGRVAIEASCSGIPVIASPTPGLQESLGESGIFANPNSVADWVEAIRSLDDEKLYKKKSKQVKDRSVQLANNFDIQMDILENKLISILGLVD
jgi:glycosyltransferase involved in cell wall biosynthesis